MKLTMLDCGVQAANCYCIQYSNTCCAFVDPGDRADLLLDYLEKNSLTLTHILLTHGHFDHTGAVKELRSATGCKVAIGAGNEIMLRDPVESGVASFGIENAERYRFEPDMLLKDGETLTLGETPIKVIGTPGHTRGDVCYLIEDMLLTGDTLFEGNCGRCDLPGGSWELMQLSLKKLRDMPGDYRVLSGHGPETRLSIERKYNPYMAEA